MQVRKQQLELDMEQRLAPNRKRSTSRLILSPCLFNFYADYIMRNSGLEEAQAGIKMARRNINNLRYADDRDNQQVKDTKLASLDSYPPPRLQSLPLWPFPTKSQSSPCSPSPVHSPPRAPQRHWGKVEFFSLVLEALRG